MEKIPFDHPLVESSIVRHNLLTDPLYRPYCGNHATNQLSSSYCYNPRTIYREVDGQFICPHCKWISQFPADFIAKYKEIHSK